MTYLSFEERERLGEVMLANMKRQHAQLTELLDNMNRHMGYEDFVYRFYHCSFKVYGRQEETLRIVEALAMAAPEERPFCDEFQQIIATGTGKEFTLEANADWVRQAGPIVQAFLHARYFLEMAVKYGPAFDKVPSLLPSELAALLELYGIR